MSDTGQQTNPQDLQSLKNALAEWCIQNNAIPYHFHGIKNIRDIMGVPMTLEEVKAKSYIVCDLDVTLMREKHFGRKNDFHDTRTFLPIKEIEIDQDSGVFLIKSDHVVLSSIDFSKEWQERVQALLDFELTNETSRQLGMVDSLTAMQQQAFYRLMTDDWKKLTLFTQTDRPGDMVYHATYMDDIARSITSPHVTARSLAADGWSRMMHSMITDSNRAILQAVQRQPVPLLTINKEDLVKVSNGKEKSINVNSIKVGDVISVNGPTAPGYQSIALPTTKHSNVQKATVTGIVKDQIGRTKAIATDMGYLTLEPIPEYSRQFSAMIIDEFFPNNSHMYGPDENIPYYIVSSLDETQLTAMLNKDTSFLPELIDKVRDELNQAKDGIQIENR